MNKNLVFTLIILSSVMLSAVEPELMIRKMFSDVCMGKNPTPNLVAPDFDDILVREVGKNTGARNLTEKLFVMKLKDYLGVTKKEHFSITVYPLKSGYYYSKFPDGKIVTNQFIDSDFSVKEYLVVIIFGKDYPVSKLVKICVRKSQGIYFVEPGACIFGCDSFFSFSGFVYDRDKKIIHFKDEQREKFGKYLREE